MSTMKFMEVDGIFIFVCQPDELCSRYFECNGNCSPHHDAPLLIINYLWFTSIQQTLCHRSEAHRVSLRYHNGGSMLFRTNEIRIIIRL